MKYEQLIIIGTGRVASSCLSNALTLTSHIRCVEHESHSFSQVKSICQNNSIDYQMITEKKKISSFFTNVKKSTLVISVHNNYIFPQQVLENGHLNIVNFHNSLLPAHPGRNAPTWAIFNRNESTGITWHQVSKEIDRGDIILQKEIPILPDVTALGLTKICADKGIETFEELLPLLINDQYQCTSQSEETVCQVHYSKDIPNKGLLDLSWNTTQIYAFLRSMDYGKLKLFPHPSVFLLGKKFEIIKYEEHQRDIDEPKQDYKMIVDEYKMILNDENIEITLFLQ